MLLSAVAVAFWKTTELGLYCELGMFVIRLLELWIKLSKSVLVLL